MENYPLVPIGYVKSDFDEKFGIPRQSGLVPSLESEIIFYPEYGREDAFRGLEEFSHIWVLWLFSKAEESGISDTVRPPRLGGNERVGVYATRSPYRKNRIGLSSLRLLSVTRRNGTAVLKVAGADMLDGTPVIDVKPYIPYTDIHTDAVGGFADDFKNYSLKVECPRELLEKLPEGKRSSLIGILSQDPRPSYKEDGDRVYKMNFANYGIRFSVSEGVLHVLDVNPLF